ncbi:hypothetical protein [Nostoc edaphicum]|uniref:hypothetical protein n=1 Tax=Nostoc edaphicum TaxID=264686 RepID=UPI001EECBAEF|nr:hypothetical protein [Nostoc edaphicum]
MNKPPSRRKKVIPVASGEPKPATDSAKENNSLHENPASATITVTAVEVRELTDQEQSLRLQLERQVERAFLVSRPGADGVEGQTAVPFHAPDF